MTKDTLTGADLRNVLKRPRDYIKMFAKSISMGYMLSPNTFKEEFKSVQSVVFNHNGDKELFFIYFNHGPETYRMGIKFNSIANNTVQVEHYVSTAVHTFVLKYPGQFWRETIQSWERVTGLPPSIAVNEGSVLSHNESFPGKRRIGEWTAMRIEYAIDKQTNNYERWMKRFRQHGMVPTESIPLGKRIRLVESPVAQKLTQCGRWNHLSHFELFYTLEAFISSYRLHEACLSDEFYKMLRDIPPLVAIDALRTLCHRQETRIWEPEAKLRAILKNISILALGHRPQLQPHHAYVYKAFVTPTTIHLNLPEVEQTNRVLRHYSQYTERFLRVHFVEEGDMQLRGSANRQQSSTAPQQHSVFDRVRETIRHGIRIGDRVYEFLGYSASQLRNHSCWFFAPTSDLSADDIRAWMGDFSQEKVVARYAARLGQCFSQTIPVLSVKQNQIMSLKDIVHNNRVFSDGIGRISQDLADQILAKLNQKSRPTAFQFRLGGAKGVLVVDQRMKPGMIAIRPSQMKFKTEHKILEINKCATLGKVALNYQIISILETLDVPDESFLQLLAEMENSMSDMIQDADKARSVLWNMSEGPGVCRDLARVVEAGFFDRGDPYVMNALAVMRASHLKDARERSKLPIAKGGSFLGVLDEYDVLEENQIFIQYGDGETPDQTVVGDVLVYRAPCLHPGDVRMCTAVDRPELRSLRNVVVFSSKGKRSVPSMCGGGDLDGDYFSVIWDERLYPPHYRRNLTPMDFEQIMGPEVERVTMDDIGMFFVNYITTDVLGQTAHTHRILSDVSTEGVLDPRCLELTKYHSIAVDYAKTGYPATPKHDLMVINEYPDYLELKEKPSYHSQKMAGKIYRSIDPTQYQQYRSSLINPYNDKYYDPRIQAPHMERYIAAARLHKRHYDRDIRDKMTNFGIMTEAELLCGRIIDFVYKDKGKRIHDVLNEARKTMSRLKHLWKSAEFPEHLPSEELEAKAAAWYYVTYHPLEQERQKRERTSYDDPYQEDLDLFSFPWIAQDALCLLVRKNAAYDSVQYPTFDEHTISQYNSDFSTEARPVEMTEEYDFQGNQGFAIQVEANDGSLKWF